MPLTDWKSIYGHAFADTRVLVTGGAGFIGSHLCEALTELGAEVVAFDDLSGTGGTWHNLDGLFRGRKIEASILDAEALAQAAAGCTLVFHHAALGSVPDSVARPLTYQCVNIEGTLNVLEAARSAEARRVVFAASSAAYGDAPGLPKTETMPTLAVSPYAATKIAGEALMQAYANAEGPDTVNLRYFNIFGPRQNANSAYAAVIAAFAKALLAGERPVVFGDGQQTRDFTHVENVVHANLLAAGAPRRLDGRVCNIAGGQSVTVNRLAAEMANMLGKPELSADHRAPRAGDVLHSSADLSTAEEALGYRPIVTFDAGLRQTVDWYATDSPVK